MDVSPLAPEARAIIREAASVYLHHTAPWFIGLISLGSAQRGGIIPGCSDIDFQLYLADPAFTEHGHLPTPLCLAIRRDLSHIDPKPFRMIQCYAFPPRLPEHLDGPIPGAYHIVAGRLPVPESTVAQIRDRARRKLSGLRATPPFGLLSHGGFQLRSQVRVLCSWVWTVLYNVLTLQQEDPIRVWRLPKQSAIGLLAEDTPLGREARSFYDAVRAYYSPEGTIDQGLLATETGVSFLSAAKVWWDTTGHRRG